MLIRLAQVFRSHTFLIFGLDLEYGHRGVLYLWRYVYIIRFQSVVLTKIVAPLEIIIGGLFLYQSVP